MVAILFPMPNTSNNVIPTSSHGHALVPTSTQKTSQVLAEYKLPLVSRCRQWPRAASGCGDVATYLLASGGNRDDDDDDDDDEGKGQQFQDDGEAPLCY